MPDDGITTTFLNTCDDCGEKWTSDEYAEKCEACRTGDDEQPEPVYKGRKNEYTGHYGTDWEDVRERVLEAANYRCEKCGMTNDEHSQRDDLFGGGLHIHHKTPAKEFDTYGEANDPSNLQALCADCHREAENE